MHNPVDDSLWMTSTIGFHHYLINSEKLITYYMYPFLDKKNVIRIGLSDVRTKNETNLFTRIIRDKIVDRAGFAKL